MNRRGKALLARLYEEALRGVDPSGAVARALARREIAGRIRRARRWGVFAAGKAAAGMFQGTPREFDAALLVLPRGYPHPDPYPGGLSGRVDVLEASHPEPDSTSVAAAWRAIRFFAGFGSEDVILCLISGGTSSLLCLPKRGLTLSEKRRRVRELARSGASIFELNRLRISLSQIKGGGLGRATRARLVTLVLSDVAGDDPSMVGSGPTIRGGARDLVRVVGSNRVGLEAARRFARRRRLRVRIWKRRLASEAVVQGARLGKAAAELPPSCVLLAGGETTVELGRRFGKGGRCLEFALGAARTIEGAPVSLLAAGSDGRDGSSRAAGAFVDGTTLARAARRGLAAATALKTHDTEPFFEALGDLFSPGPTGTNVADWVFAARVSRARKP